jgi:hypothetical protein
LVWSRARFRTICLMSSGRPTASAVQREGRTPKLEI